MAKAIGPSFRVVGIEPPEVRSAAPEVRLKFWSVVLAYVMEAKDRDLAAGLDRYGKPMAALARSTIVNRRSAMGPADPHAPPLTPAHGLSRTRALLTGKATASGVVCWWLYDAHTRASWGEILKHHRAGSHRLPKRDVIGLSPAARAEVAAKAAAWWARYRKGLEDVPRTPAPAVGPGADVPFTVQAVDAKKERSVSELIVNGKHYTFQSGSAAQVRRAIADGTFSGFQTRAEVKAAIAARKYTYKADGSIDWAEYFARSKPPPGGGPAPPPTPPKPKPPAFGSFRPRAAAKPERPDLDRKRPTKPVPEPRRDRPAPTDVPAFPPSQARVVFGRDQAEARATADAARRTLGDGASPERIASLVGAPDDAVIELFGSRGSATLSYAVRHPRFSLWTGRFERSADRGLVHRIDYIEVFAAARGQGLGARVHGRQVYWGTIHGVDRLSLTAARAPDKNGYITWPVFGYDGKIPDRIREVMPERLRAFAMIQDLLEDDEGADWWHDEGKTIALTFDLTEGSDQRRRWATYWKIRTRSRVDPPS